jgi:hypothetical protein
MQKQTQKLYSLLLVIYIKNKSILTLVKYFGNRMKQKFLISDDIWWWFNRNLLGTCQSQVVSCNPTIPLQVYDRASVSCITSIRVTVKLSDMWQSRKYGVPHTTSIQVRSVYCNSVFGCRGLSTSGESLVDTGHVWCQKQW